MQKAPGIFPIQNVRWKTALPPNPAEEAEWAKYT